MEVTPKGGRSEHDDPVLVRLSVVEAIAIQALRQCSPEKREAALYLLQTLARECIKERPSNVVLLTGRKLA